MGGEDEGLKRMKSWIFEKRSIEFYTKKRHELVGEDNTSRLSPWLANGCVSVRHLYHEVERFEHKFGFLNCEDSCREFKGNLLWRDFYRFWFLKNNSVRPNPFENIEELPKSFVRWMKGKTGLPIIDALMRGMNTLGYMPPRGRAVVTSFLVNDLKLDYSYGASIFEEKLIDHDFHLNDGGWRFFCGLERVPH